MREKWHFITAVLTASILTGSMLSQAFAAPMDYTVSVDDENHFIFYDFDEVQVRIPDEWEDSLLVLPEEEKVGFTIRHLMSQHLMQVRKACCSNCR